MSRETFTIERPEPGSVEWLAARQPFFNASDVAALAGEHPFTTISAVAVDKLDPPAPETNAAIDRGHRLEPVVADWWAEKHKVDVVEPDVMFGAGRLLANPDRLIVGRDDELLEVKSTSRSTGIERYHWWQAQAQMATTGAHRVHFALLNRQMQFVDDVVDRDDDSIAWIFNAVDEFMAWVDLGMVPEDEALSVEQLTRLHPVSDGTTADLPDEAREWAIKLARARKQKKLAEATEDEAKAWLARHLGDAETGVCAGVPVVSWKSNKPGETVDMAALEAAHPRIVAKFRKAKPGNRVMKVLIKEAPSGE